MHRALPTTRRRAVPAAVVCALLLTACGSGGSTTGGSGLPTFSASAGTSTTAAPSASASASAEPEPHPSPWTALPTISEGPNKGVYSGIVLASSVAETDEEKAAVDVYVEYWKYLAQVGYDVKIDRAKADGLAFGAALDRFDTYVSGLKKKKARTIGWASINVTKVAVGANSILITACVDNGSYDVAQRSGDRLEQGSKAYDALGALRSIDGTLKVTSFRAPGRKTACETGS